MYLPPPCCSYSFDKIIERRNTDSVKWSRFGADVLPLWVADMDFEAPIEIIDAIKKRAEHGIFGYGDGYQALRDTIAQRMGRLFCWSVKPDEVRCYAGILPIFYFTICELSKHTDGVLLFTPAYPPFFKLIKQSGRPLVEYALEESRVGDQLEYNIDFEKLAATVPAHVKILVLCSPHNPVGKVFDHEELEKLTQFCLARGITIISDEIHSELVLDGKHIPTATISDEAAQITITLSGPTKTFNLPGLKVGSAIIQNQELRKRIFDSSSEAVSDVGPISAVGALAAYQHGDKWLKEMLFYIRQNRDCFETFFKANFPRALFTHPAATYMTWADMGAYKTDKSPFELALAKGKVACGRGRDFGEHYQDYLRISLACPRTILEDGLNRLKTGLLT